MERVNRAALDLFSPTARAWFQGSFGATTEIQEKGWPEIAAGRHALLCAPTGSGKTLAAFFWCLDRLLGEPAPLAAKRCRVLYVSPLKALAFDIDRNLRSPLAGLALEATRRASGNPPLESSIIDGGVGTRGDPTRASAPIGGQAITVGLRTGDTPPADRRDMQRHPPDILITTPESLFLLLTSASRSILQSVRWVVVDEIHTMAATKRGAHLAVSLERLCRRTESEPQRIGLSATQKPLEEVARYLGGRGREVSIVDAGLRKTLDLSVEVPAQDMARLDLDSSPDSAGVPPRGRTSAQADVGITTAVARARPWATPDGDGVARVIAPDQDRRLPAHSTWPSIYPRILELIRSHHSTIVFVNSRRMAERLAAKLNELAEEELVMAHHGSIAREQRLVVEERLKAGTLPALVATSSLELGIDMGAVDLVIQVSSPTSVSRGIQRIGRAGHSVGEPSTGTILPTHRGDLLECATVVERMLAGEIETTRVPRNPLDILAQQIVAMSALDSWQVDDLRAAITGAYPFADLGDRAFSATLDMLDGRYPSQEFAGLRARVTWDRMNGTVRGRQGAQRLAVISGGTIPDRGLFTVNLLDDGKRVGELDEEMVYELRAGETFVLGATTWKAVEITQSQVRVVPAPGEPAKISFWHGDALGRPVEVGRAVGALTREVVTATDGDAIVRLIGRSRCDLSAAKNLVSFLREQESATGAVPDDRTVVVERFRDQLGDWRVCVLTPYGARIHAPWALAIQAALEEKLGLEIQSIYSDDGFALRLVDAEVAPRAEDVLLDPDDVREAVTAQLHGSPLFASRFRENAARALLLPRMRPGSRTPLWLQRQRSADLLQVAARFPDFPILAETYRECLTDVFDLDALRDLMAKIQSREVRVVEVETASPSPFSSSLLFAYVAQFMYEGDTPLAERRIQALTLDRELLSELLGAQDLRELLDTEVIGRTELELQGLLPDRWPRDADEALDALRRLGDLSGVELEARGVGADWLHQLASSHRAFPVRLAGQERWIAADDAGLYRDALGSPVPRGIPEAFLQTTERPFESLLVRWANTHVPFTPSEPSSRWDVPVNLIAPLLDGMAEQGCLVAGQFRAGGHEREFCSPDVLRLIRRRSLAALRREIEPVSPLVLARYLPGWQGVGVEAVGLDRLANVIHHLQGYPVPISVLERDVLTGRMAHYSPQLLDELVASGEVVWIGQGPLGPRDGRVVLYLRRDVGQLANARPTGDAPTSDLHDRLRQRLVEGACFFVDLLAASGTHATEPVLDALWGLVWAGEVTNDTFAPLRFVGPSHRASRRGLGRLGPPRSLGRWSLVTDLLRTSISPTERLYAQTELLLQRYGILTREHALAEGLTGGFVGIYPVLRSLEESGKIRRGYFVEGLGGSQFALPGAVDRLRNQRGGKAEITLLAAIDPANAYGVTSAWPDLNGRGARAAGAYVILDAGELRLYVERGRRSILTSDTIEPAHVEKLAVIAARAGKIEINNVNGAPVGESTIQTLLLEAGFVPTHKGLVLYGTRRG